MDDRQPVMGASAYRRGCPRALVALVLIASTVALAAVYRDALSFERLAAREAEFKSFERERPVATYSTAFFLYVVVTALSIPVATPLSILYGWLFGFWRALVLVSFASTTGATCSFLMSRYFLGSLIQQRHGGRVAAFNAALDAEGPFYLLTLRLVPYVPFFVVNLVMGLTRMRTRTFWWVSQLGMLPATAVYLWAASSLKSLNELQRDGVGGLVTPQLAIALTLLGLVPLMLRWLLRKWRRATVVAVLLLVALPLPHAPPTILGPRVDSNRANGTGPVRVVPSISIIAGESP